ADERGEQLLVRGAPRNLLHADVYARMPALELGQQLLHHLALAAHRPESHLARRRSVTRATRKQQRKYQWEGAAPSVPRSKAPPRRGADGAALSHRADAQRVRAVVEERAQSCHGSAPKWWMRLARADPSDHPATDTRHVPR